MKKFIDFRSKMIYIYRSEYSVYKCLIPQFLLGSFLRYTKHVCSTPHVICNAYLSGPQKEGNETTITV